MLISVCNRTQHGDMSDESAKNISRFVKKGSSECRKQPGGCFAVCFRCGRPNLLQVTFARRNIRGQTWAFKPHAGVVWRPPEGSFATAKRTVVLRRNSVDPGKASLGNAWRLAHPRKLGGGFGLCKADIVFDGDCLGTRKRARVSCQFLQH